MDTTQTSSDMNRKTDLNKVAADKLNHSHASIVLKWFLEHFTLVSNHEHSKYKSNTTIIFELLPFSLRKLN